MKRILLAMIIFTMSNLAYAENVDLQKFLQETQKISQDHKTFHLVWWIPTEYWKESFKNEPNMTQAQKAAFYNAVDDYIVFSVIDAKITELGSIVPVSKDEIASKLSLTIGKGDQMPPLPDAALTSDAKNIFAMMKPLIANMLGQFGKGLEFVCFKGKDDKGARLLDPKGSRSFSVNYSGHSYNWRLPLGCLLPVKIDEVTGEEFPGNYIYNPFTGSKLMQKATAP